MLLSLRHSSHLFIWDLVRHLGSLNKLLSILSKNVENRLEQPLYYNSKILEYIKEKEPCIG